MTRAHRGLLAIALIVAACSSSGATPIIVYVTPAPNSTPFVDDPVPPEDGGLGLILFGTSYNADTLLIDKPITRFKRTYPEIAWSALLTRTIDATSMQWIIASQSAAGVERTIVSQEQEVGSPDSDLLANSADLAFLVDNKAGTYVMRYVESGEILAEGTFTLVN
jgi:hypothetical protein